MKPVDQLSALLSTTDSEMSFSRVVDAIPVPIWVSDTKKHCYFLNKHWYALTGTRFGEDTTETWPESIHPEDLDIFLRTLDGALDTKECFQYKFRLKCLEDKYHWVNGIATPLYNSNDVFVGYIGAATDVQQQQEDREQLERELERRIEELNRKNHELEQGKLMVEAVLDSTVSMISVIDSDLNVLSINRGFETYIGKTKAAVIGKNVFEVFPYLKETDFSAYIKKALTGEFAHVPVFESMLQEGRYLEAFFIPLLTLSRVERVVVKVRDRTDDTLLQQKLIENNTLLEAQNRALKRQSDFIESLFDATVDVIAVFDTEFRFISVNKKCLGMYALKKEEILGKKLTALFPSVEKSAMYRDLQRAMKGEFVHDLTYRSGVLPETDFENFYVPLFDDQNSVYAVMVIGHDITQLVEMSEQLRLSNEILEEKNIDLQRSNEDLVQFAYVASHDLQEPIRKIATYSNKLLTRSKDKFSDETVLYLQRISRSTERMFELINGLLQYSRIRRENDLFEIVSLDDVFKQVLGDFELAIKQKKAVVKMQHLTDLEAVPVQMNQMFTNLISNSLKFTRPEVTPVIQIAASDLTEEQKKFYRLNLKARYVNIFYLDNGIGFEQQYADKIFDLFQRLHNRNTYEGSGIGLALCKKIVANHHGKIYAFSEKDKGATFQIILPYRQKPFA